MNSLTYGETKKTIEAPFIDLASLAAEERNDRGASSVGFSRGTEDSLPGDQDSTASDTAPLPSAASEPFSAPVEKGLLTGLLKQAARDLRQFRSATTRVEQELYLDAYSWIAANDFSWPFSFLNVCKALGLVPDVVRDELLGDSPSGWFGYCRKIGGRLTRALQVSLVSGFTGRRALEKPESNWSVPVTLWQ